MLDRGRLDTEYPGPSPGEQRFYANEGVGFWIDVKATYKARRGERINVDTSRDAVLHDYLSNLLEY